MLAAGEEMASTRALSSELTLNPMTISKAYSLLEREGVLDRRRGQTLVVRAISAADLEANKLEPLRQHLAAAVVMARQLNLSREQALRLFRETFDSRSP
jgi:GntR family transcriptional regulator